MSVINFNCIKCRKLFDGDVGTVSFSVESPRPIFEKEIVCPRCGSLTMDEVELTELGQSQMTELDMQNW